jgi:hypothetical protein
LRAYTIFKAEYKQSRTEKKPYIRTPLEWELLGDLCLRLHHHEDAKECFQFFVEMRFSFRIWHKLLQLYMIEGKPHLILGACEKMISALDRWKWAELAVSICTLSRDSLAVDAQHADSMFPLASSLASCPILCEVGV